MIKKIVADNPPTRLGATVTKKGVNFGLFSENAEKVEICFFDAQHRETQRITLPFVTKNIWHGVISNVAPGEFYGYRIYGPWQPKSGHRFNHHKLLLDPYAKKLSHLPDLQPSFYAFKRDAPDADLVFDDQDNAKFFPKAVISYNLPTYRGQKINIPLSQTVLYELHIKSISKLHPEVPKSSQGKFSGLKHPAVISHLKKLGVTTLKIMPTQVFLSEQKLLDQGLRNYWGYNPLNFFIPHPAYGESNDARRDFISMVTELHKNELEVVVDLVFNHTAETDHLGPNLCFRGIDNLNYYMLSPNNLRFYQNHSGCGNVLKSYHPAVMRLIIDSLEEWADLGVDGIRFDLGSLLAINENNEFDPKHPIFAMIAQNPKLNQLKLISEPWDLNGYHLGKFPNGWTELNDKFRDTARQAASLNLKSLKPLAHILAGTADLFSLKKKEDHRPLNYITNHDGMNMLDLVSYSKKYNLANGQNNLDGLPHNNSVNHGIEGSSDDHKITAKRLQHIKNLLLLLFVGQGIPALQSGDEMGHSRKGNSNPFCQDNEVNWLSWQENIFSKQLIPFLNKLVAWRKENARFFELQQTGVEFRNIYWFNHQGKILSAKEWDETQNIAFGMMWILAESKQAFYALINLTANHLDFHLPEYPLVFNWRLKICSSPPEKNQRQAPASIIIWQSA